MYYARKQAINPVIAYLLLIVDYLYQYTVSPSAIFIVRNGCG